VWGTQCWCLRTGGEPELELVSGVEVDIRETQCWCSLGVHPNMVLVVVVTQ
jgi:hypothetical protein